MAVTPSRQKFIYITGCDTGFGSILIRKLDKLGFGVIAGIYLEKSKQEIQASCSSHVYPVVVDVSKEESVNAAAKEIEKIVTDNKGELHGVVNNAGILVTPGPAEWTPTESYTKMFNVNVLGTVMTVKSLLPLVRKSQGRIVNVASIAGRMGLPSSPAYCATKYAVEGYSDVLRRDLLVWNVSVHIIEPGIFSQTGLYNSFQTGLDGIWERLDTKLKADYGEKFYKGMRDAIGKAVFVGGSKNSDLVPLAMIDALTAAKPKYRYRVGNDSKYIISLVEKLHENTQDRILIPLGKDKNWPASAPPNGRQLIEGRYHKDWTRFILMVLVGLFILNKVRK